MTRDDIRTPRDVKTLPRRKNCIIREGKGSHFVVITETGHRIPARNHGGDGKPYKPGMRCKIVKALAASGLLASLVLAWLTVV
jgi:hypothetical protein